MQARSLMLLAVALLLGAGVGFAVLSQDVFAVAVPPGAPPPSAAMPLPEAAVGPDEAPQLAAGDHVAGDHVRGDAAAPVDAIAHRRDSGVDTSGWTSGTLRGDIQLAVSVLDRLQTITIAVEECRNPNVPSAPGQRPWRRFVAVELGIGTPTFEVTDIPFSTYPYLVSVHAPGLNGARRTVTIDQDHPLVDDVVLAITPGAPFTLLVRDQDNVPMTNVDVQMSPVGEPAGRTLHRGKTDTVGCLVCEDTLAGEYQVLLTLDGQQLIEPQRINVVEGNTLTRGRIQGQGVTLQVPRGVEVEVLVSDIAGYGIPEAEVTAVFLESTRAAEHKLTTDVQGRVRFPHLPAGTWQISMTKDRYQRGDLQIRVKNGDPPQVIRKQLIRLR